jgi:4-amino-4-deoxy-L-arabinose transferase-like glycosyltransferase
MTSLHSTDLTASAATPVQQAVRPNAPEARPLPAVRQFAERLLLVVAGVFLLLHFVHLRADFPNRSPWMDWSKYTDEGWYGDAAIRNYQLGHWYVPGDFNAAAALPVWPALELVLFRITGVSLSAARALSVSVFALTVLICSLLLRQPWGRELRKRPRQIGPAPALSAALLAISPFCFVFSRLAILEPLLVLETASALLLASTLRDSRRATDARSISWLSAALGVLLAAIVLTKTTGIFLFPAVVWMVWAACEYSGAKFLRVSAIVCAVAAATWGAYFLLFIRPRYLADYRYLFSANAYTGITRATFWQVLSDTLTDTSWVGKTLVWLAMFAVAGWTVGLAWDWLKSRRAGNPLAVALLLWAGGYWAFLAYHANLQPRYYFVLAAPLTMLVAMAFDWLLAAAVAAIGRVKLVYTVACAAFAVALAVALVAGAVRTLGYVAHPEYGWVSAAERVREAVDAEHAAHPDHSRLVLSISGSEISLMTGLPSICDDFGTMTLPDRIAKYRPGWFATWNDVEDDKMEALAPMYRLERVLSVPVFDDPDRNLLILYRLDPLQVPGAPGRPGRRRYLSVPRHLRTRLGEQPSPVQLRH